jgi:hypothetical protein
MKFAVFGDLGPKTANLLFFCGSRAVVPYIIDEMRENIHPAFLVWKQNSEKCIVKTPMMYEEVS